jgi:hypothetical protein
MFQAHLLYWELYGPHTEVVLRADLSDDGYSVTLRRDGELVYAVTLNDRHVLLRMSSVLRSHFQDAGYRPQRFPHRAPVLIAGPCWGPAAPLQASVFSELHDTVLNEPVAVERQPDAA